MLPSEREKIMLELCRMWPNKFEDSELEDFCNRMMVYRQNDVLTAVNEHKNTKPFAPKVNEILAKLKGKEATTATKPHEQSFADVIRQQDEQLRPVRDDREVLLRYWRKVWYRHEMDLRQRRQAAGMSTPGQAIVDDLAKARRQQCEVGCVNSLMAVPNMEVKTAERLAAWVFSAVDEFRMCLGELRGADQPDPFAGSSAPQRESAGAFLNR